MYYVYRVSGQFKKTDYLKRMGIGAGVKLLIFLYTSLYHFHFYNMVMIYLQLKTTNQGNR
jgi:hypothetical protein